MLRVLVLLLISSTALAGNLSFLQGSTISRFNAEDIDLMMKNADEVLASDAPKAKREWSNPKTGSSGFAEAVGQFTARDGKACKRLRVENRAKDTPVKQATYTLCRHGEEWMLDSTATPAA
jgi:hypothetical protein